MPIDPEAIDEAILKAITSGKELRDERKALTRYTPAELRALIALGQEANEGPSQDRTVMRARRVKL